MRKRYVVYGHVAPDGEVFYIGCGRADRPFSTNNRNQKWRETVDRLDHYGVHIFLSSDDSGVVSAKETELIESYSPSCNLQAGGMFNPVEPPVVTIARLVVGEVFEFASSYGYWQGPFRLVGRGEFESLADGEIRKANGNTRVIPLRKAA